jgi:hypothetical protein
MTTYIDTKIIAITSQSANIKKNGSYLSNLRYEFGQFLTDEPDIIHRQIQLLNAQIPYSFYVVNYTNQLFKYKLGTGSITIVTIPVGNYTANSLITAIKTAVADVNFLITISSINGKLTFTYNNSFIIYNDFTYSIGSILGFEPNLNQSSITNAITAPYPCNLLGIKTLQVRSNNLSCNNVSSVQGGSTILLSTIPVSAVPFGMIDYKDVGNNLISISNITLDDLDIEIISGEDGNYINFNNQDWTMTLVIHIHRLTQPLVKPTMKDLLQTKDTHTEFNPIDTINPIEPKINNKDLEELNILTA